MDAGQKKKVVDDVCGAIVGKKLRLLSIAIPLLCTSKENMFAVTQCFNYLQSV